MFNGASCHEGPVLFNWTEVPFGPKALKDRYVRFAHGTCRNLDLDPDQVTNEKSRQRRDFH
jgi:hypothetical protein